MHSSVQVLLSFATLTTLSAGILAPSASAQRGDVWLYTDAPNHKIGLGVVNEEGTEFTPGVRTLQAILVPDTLPFSSFDYSAEEPGFRSAVGDLPALQTITLTPVLLSVWNGTGLEPAAGVVFGFDSSGTLGSDSDGTLHEHPLFGLTDLTANPLPLPDGVYVADFRASTAGLGESDLYRFVMLKDALITGETDAEDLVGLLEDYENGGPAPEFAGKDFTFFETATEFASVPEPAGVVLALGSALILIRSRPRPRRARFSGRAPRTKS